MPNIKEKQARFFPGLDGKKIGEKEYGRGKRKT